MGEWATPEDIRRASSPEEGATALEWQSEQTEIAGHRIAILDLLRGNPVLARELVERWAALKPDPGRRKRRVVEL